MRCDQCEMLSINGIPCHETGCPNTNARWDGEEWIKQAKCFECGCMVDCDSRGLIECNCHEDFFDELNEFEEDDTEDC